MDLVPAGMVTALRAAAQSAMPGTAVIQRNTSSDDLSGGQFGTFAAVGTVPCRAVPQKANQSEGIVGARYAGQQEWFVYVPVGTDVQASSDHLVVNGGGTFEVIAVHAGRAYEPSRRCVCVEVR